MVVWFILSYFKLIKSDFIVVIGFSVMFSEMKVIFDNKNWFNLCGVLVLLIVLVVGVLS